ncbi:MAG: PEP-CTERM sorting domain-containing protein [Armatimonadota bacterium]|nr:PEP-CTERM sorting domain-containing protein [Armatimonadota bacterium]
MGKRIQIAFLLVVLGNIMAIAPSVAVVVNFDDIAVGTNLTASGYGGLAWEPGNTGAGGNQGYWLVEAPGYPHSGRNFVMNAYGSTLLGLAFPTQVNVTGAYFAAQGNPIAWTTGVRVHGYRAGSEVAVTDWFTDIDTQSDWFTIGLNNVDRIVVESVPVKDGGGWYAMDDFTYEPVPEPSSMLTLLFGIAGAGGFIRRRARVPLLQNQHRQ